MNHELHIILMYLKTFTVHNPNPCRHILYKYDACKGIGCRYCVLSTCTTTSDRYAPSLIFRVPI